MTGVCMGGDMYGRVCMAGGVAGRGCLPGVDMHGRGCKAGGMHGREACAAGGVCLAGRVCMARSGLCIAGTYMAIGCEWGACMAGEMATEAGGMHPTRMHPFLLL